MMKLASSGDAYFTYDHSSEKPEDNKKEDINDQQVPTVSQKNQKKENVGKSPVSNEKEMKIYVEDEEEEDSDPTENNASPKNKNVEDEGNYSYSKLSI
jgi:hypothetical protein